MKKIALYAFALLATAFTACTEDFADWAEPQGFEQEEAIGVSFSATAGAPIDMATVTGETVSVFTPSVTAEGMTSVSYSINVEGTTLETDGQGNVSVADLKKITESKYGKAPEQRTLAATVSAFIAMGDEVLKETAPIEIKITLVAPQISNKYYIIGEPSAWDPTCTTMEFSHSDTNVYDDPIFTIVFAPVDNDGEGFCWFAVTDDVAVEKNDWEYVMGCMEGNGNNGESGKIARRLDLEDDGSFKIPVDGSAKFIKMTLNMMDYTYTIEKLNFGEYIYIPGDHVTDWNPALAPALASPAFDGVYTGFAYLNTQFKFTHARNWDNEYNYSSFSTYSDIFSGEGTGNINVSTPGFYYLEANVPAASLTATPTTWGIIGPAQAGGWDSDTDMEWNVSEECWVAILDLAADEFKFRANDDWGINVGGNMDDLVKDGGNIRLEEAGTYEVKLYLTRSTSDKLYCTVTKK